MRRYRTKRLALGVRRSLAVDLADGSERSGRGIDRKLSDRAVADIRDVSILTGRLYGDAKGLRVHWYTDLRSQSNRA